MEDCHSKTPPQDTSQGIRADKGIAPVHTSPNQAKPNIKLPVPCFVVLCCFVLGDCFHMQREKHSPGTKPPLCYKTPQKDAGKSCRFAKPSHSTQHRLMLEDSQQRRQAFPPVLHQAAMSADSAGTKEQELKAEGQQADNIPCSHLLACQTKPPAQSKAFTNRGETKPGRPSPPPHGIPPNPAFSAPVGAQN
jgi:hypothetical protein